MSAAAATSYVAALLPSNSPHWGTGGSVLNSSSLGAGAVVTYSFLTSSAGLSSDNAYGFAAMSSTQKAAVRQALATWSAVANVTFSETSSASDAMVRFGTNNQGGVSAGYAYYPSTSSTGGLVLIANDDSSNITPAVGTYGFSTLVHEIGHALGLKHPGNYNAGGGGTEGPYLPTAQDNYAYSIMSYNDNASLPSGINLAAPSIYDIAAIQYLYGANTAAKPGNDTYTLSRTQFTTIWDPNGTNTLDASAQTQATILDMRGGGFSSIGGTLAAAVAYNSTIQLARGGSGSDTIYANDLQVTIAGGTGTDTVVFTGASTGYTLAKSGSTVTVTRGSIVDTLTGIESLQFTDRVIATSAITTTAGTSVGADTGRRDFNADGKADILWQNDDGQAAIWLMNGTTVSGGSTVGSNPGASWHVRGSGDFNADGKADILWQNDSGQAAVWLMDGTTLIGTASVGSNSGAAWKIKGCGDFDGDGKADILWQNDSGQAAVWLMDGTTLSSTASVGSNPGAAWKIKGCGDFDGDGKADILWQNDNGPAAIWLMNGTSLSSAASVGGDPGAAWKIKGLSDFDGDGKADILWRNDSGQAAIWLMNGAAVSGSATIGGNPGTTWNVYGSADFDGDGKGDILWRNDSGQAAIWLMNGTSLAGSSYIGGNPGTTWSVVAYG